MKNVPVSNMKGKLATVSAGAAALALTAGSAMAQTTIVDDLFTKADPAALVTKVGTFLVAIIAIPIAFFVYRKVKTLFGIA